MPNENSTDNDIIYSKGTELDLLAKNLVQNAYDDNEETRTIMQQSITSLGINEPKLLLSLILVFLRGSMKNKKVPNGHRVILLLSMKEILKVKDLELREMSEFVSDIIKQVIDEMTTSKDVLPEWQSAASDVLVILSTHYCKEVMTPLSSKIQPSVLPHYFVIQTLGSMASNNPYDMVPYLTATITEFLTLLAISKSDNYRWVIANCLSQFCESIMEYVANPDRVTDHSIGVHTFSSYIFSAFEVFLNSWVNTKEPKLRKAVMDALGNMSFIIDRNNFETHLPKLISVVLSLYKKHSESYHVTKALSQILLAANGNCSRSTPSLSETDILNDPEDIDVQDSSETSVIQCAALTAELDNLIGVLFNQLQQSIDMTLQTGLSNQQQMNTVRNQNEVKRCFTTLCMSHPDHIVAICLHRIDPANNPIPSTSLGLSSTSSGNSSNMEKQRLAALMVLRHIISCCDSYLKPRRNELISGLRGLLGNGYDITLGNQGNSAPSTVSVVTCSNNVKMHMAHIIIAMGGQGYLLEAGGSRMIEFIVRHCGLPLKPEAKARKLKIGNDNSEQQVTNEQLRKFCENVLHLGSSTVRSMRQVLWPLVMEMIVPVDYTEAVGTICCVIENLFCSSGEANGRSTNVLETENTNPDTAGADGEDIECFLDYDIQVNIPGPQFLMSRLLVLAGVPIKNNVRGIHILRALNVLVDNFHESLSEIWNLIIPKLITYLEKTNNLNFEDEEDNEDKKFDQTQWEELMLKLIAKSIEHINDEDWTSEFGDAMGQHIALYDKYPEEKGFLFKCLGTIMANSNKKSFIDKHLDLIYNSTRFLENDERNGLAVAYGISSASHIDTVLTKLEQFIKQDNRKSHGLFSLFKDKGGSGSHADSADKELVRASIMLAYANSIFYSPKPLLTSRLESFVVKILQQNLKHSKDQTINKLVIESNNLIARALHPKLLGKSYKFDLRNELITAILSFIEAEPNNSIHSDIRALAMETIGNLIVLPPAITNVEMERIVNICIDSVSSLPPDGIPVSKKTKELAFDEAQHLTLLMKETFDSLTNLCTTILRSFYSNLTFNELYKVLRSRLTSEHEHVRERALTILSLILKSYYEQLSDTNNQLVYQLRKAGTQLSCSGTIIGDVIPRLADPGFNNRQLSVDCIGIVLEIQCKMELGRDAFDDPSLASISSIKERLKKFDSNIVFGAVNDLSKVVCKKLNSVALESILESLYIGVTDLQKHGDSAVCVMLNALFRLRYSDVEQFVPTILTKLHDILPNIVDNPRTGVLRAIRILASHYLIETLNCLMSQSLPLDDIWSEILTTVVNDEVILDKCLVHLMELLARSMPFEERDDPGHRKVKGQSQKILRIPCHQWLAILNCLQISLSSTISIGCTSLTKVYPRLLTTLLLSLSSTVICSPLTGKSFEKKSGLEANLQIGVKPFSIAKDALDNFFTTTQSHEILEEINVRNAWNKVENEEEFMDFIQIIIKSICDNRPQELHSLISYLIQNINSNHEHHRILVVGCFESIVSGVANGSQEGLVDTIITQLVSKLADKSLEVRRLSLLAIGAVGGCSDPLVQRHSTSLLSALLMGMDDRHDDEDQLINAAMDGLSSLLSKLTEKDVRDVLVTVCLRMLSCYERENESVRASAFRLFGALSRLAAYGPSKQRLLTETDSVIVPLLVHLEDPSSEVVRACKYTLKQIMPLYSVSHCLAASSDTVNSESTNKMNEFIQMCLREDTVLHFGEFCNDFSKLMTNQIQPQKMTELIMRCLVYFKSEQLDLAASSVLLTGFLMRNLPATQKEALQKGQICIELIQLLHCKNAKVRSRTAQAISLLDIY